MRITIEIDGESVSIDPTGGGSPSTPTSDGHRPRLAAVEVVDVEDAGAAPRLDDDPSSPTAAPASAGSPSPVDNTEFVTDPVGDGGGPGDAGSAPT